MACKEQTGCLRLEGKPRRSRPDRLTTKMQIMGFNGQVVILNTLEGLKFSFIFRILPMNTA